MKTAANAQDAKGTRYSLADFELLENIGVGSYSFVHKVMLKSTGAIYALKIIEKKHVVRHDKVKYIMLEKDLLIRMSLSIYVIKLHGTFQDEHRLYYVLDYMPCGDLEAFLKSHPNMSPEMMRHIMKQLVMAVGDLHANFIVHRDLKPENILLDENSNIKFIDFGSALDMLPLLRPSISEASEDNLMQSMQRGMNLAPSYAIPVQRDNATQEKQDASLRAHSFVGTAHYVPPELIHSIPIPLACLFAMDWWSLGVLFYQILTHGKLPFQASNDFLVFQRILRLDYEVPEGVPADAMDLIRLLLKPNPEERIPKDGSDMCSFILRQPFFARI